jgi:hypothetical protein
MDDTNTIARMIEYSYTYDNSTSISQNVQRDPDIHNRFWFWYPPEWRTANVKNKVIGFRSFWIAQAKRHLVFTVNITKPPLGEIQSHKISVWMGYDEDILKLYDKLKEYLEGDSGTVSVDWISLEKRRFDNIYEGKNWAAYDSNVKGEQEICVEQCFGIKFFVTDKASLGTTFTITDMNQDSKYFFNVEDDYPSTQAISYNTLEFYDIWDRRSCLLKSSLVNGYLGYSKVRYNPLKYYKITNNDEKFYIDLYNGHNHDLISVLPHDNLDHLSLEIVVMY